MPLIIDCYNVLHATMPPGLAGMDEAGLCRAVARSIWRGERTVVVCDGSVKPHTISESPVASVELIYSGPGRSADDVILEMIESDTAPRRLVVVSTDRELRKAARRRRARALTSEEFIHILATPLAPGADPVGRAASSPLDKAQVDRWLKQFGFDPVEEERKRDEFEL